MSSSLYSLLPETTETQFAKELNDILREVRETEIHREREREIKERDRDRERERERET